jgi:hypothetical protein
MLVLCLTPVTLLAGPTYDAHATLGYEYNSNVFDLSGAAQSDRVQAAIIGLDAQYLWDQQSAHFGFEGRHFEYQTFGDLDHYEYLLTGGLKWQFTERTDGGIDLKRERTMVLFSELVGTALYLQTQDTGTAQLNFRVAPEWRLENMATVMRLDSPRPGFADLSQHESSLHEAIRYLGISNLTAGLTADYLDGRFEHATAGEDDLHYRQVTAQLAANYTLHEKPALDAAVGYSRRQEIDGRDVTAITWLVGYNRALTGKTSINLLLNRTINSYVSTASPEVDTGASAGVTWLATGKISLAVHYAFIRSNFPQYELLGDDAPPFDRADHYQQLLLDITYSVRRWLSIHPYLRYQDRRSNSAVYEFRANVVGVELRGDLR